MFPILTTGVICNPSPDKGDGVNTDLIHFVLILVYLVITELIFLDIV